MGFVNTFLDLLFDHVVEGEDQYQELLKPATVPEDLCAHPDYQTRQKGGSRKTSVTLQASKLTLIEVLHCTLFPLLIG